MESSITSNRVRTIAAEAIENYGRPMTTHEIENYIKMNDHELYKEIKTKCYDYVRMILSVTKISPFVKYKCLKRIIGIDKRANFFGFPNGNYDPNLWVNIEKRTNKEILPQMPPQNYMVMQPFENPIRYILVDEETALKSWNNIRLRINQSDPLMLSLIEAMKEVKTYREKGFTENDTVRYAISKYKYLQNSFWLQDVINILSRVAYDSKELKNNSDFMTVAFSTLQ